MASGITKLFPEQIDAFNKEVMFQPLWGSLLASLLVWSAWWSGSRSFFNPGRLDTFWCFWLITCSNQPRYPHQMFRQDPDLESSGSDEVKPQVSTGRTETPAANILYFHESVGDLMSLQREIQKIQHKLQFRFRTENGLLVNIKLGLLWWNELLSRMLPWI